jgi:hypothetical protein
MNISRAVLCAVCMGLAGVPAKSQVMTPNTSTQRELRESVFGLGLGAGFASGIGLSFRHHFPGRMAWQAVGGIVKTRDKLLYSVGGEIQFDVQRTASTRFFVAAAAGYYYSGDGTNEMEAPGRIGLGVGGEIPIAESLGLSGEILFTYQTDGSVLPLPQAAIHYYFN